MTETQRKRLRLEARSLDLPTREHATAIQRSYPSSPFDRSTWHPADREAFERWERAELASKNQRQQQEQP